MTEERNLTLEGLNGEFERFDSLLRTMSVQIAGLRARVADLETWGPSSETDRGGIRTVAGKENGPAGDTAPGTVKRLPGTVKNQPGPGKGKEGKGKQGKGKQGKGKGGGR